MLRFWRRHREDFSDEIQSHLDLEADRLVSDGLGREEASAAARKSFGNVLAAQERFHEANHWMWLEQLRQDVIYGWRGLRQSPAFLLTTVLTLAIGLSLSTVAFTVVNAYALRPFAVADPHSLYRLGWRSDSGGGPSFRWRDYEELRERRELFDAVIADLTRYVSSNGRTLLAAFVSSNYLEVLGPHVQIGRPFVSSDGGAPVAVLSDQGWARLFARDRGVVGRNIEIDGRTVTVIGVLRPEFTGLDAAPRDVWLPIAGSSTPVEITTRLGHGVTAARANAALTPAVAAMVNERLAGRPEARTARAFLSAQSTAIELSADVLAVLSPVFAAFALVLLTACANVSNMMLSRAIVRHKEIAVRLSLGAGRARIVRQLLTEGLLIASIGGAVALALALWAVRAGLAILFGTLPPSVAVLVRVSPLTFDWRVFLFAFAAAAAATLVFALLPALQATRARLTDALRGQQTATPGGARLRAALVTAQVAVSLVLVVVALTLARNGAAVGSSPLGFQPDGVLSVNVRGELDGHPLVERLAAMLEGDPRAAQVAVTGGNPLFIRSRAVAASPSESPASGGTRFTFVSPGYFPVLRIPIERGRGFSMAEAASSARVAIVSRATANAFWPGVNPIGRTIRIEHPEGRPVDEIPGYAEVTVVGVAGDVVSGFMVDGRDTGHIYLPMTAADPHAIALLVKPRVAGGLDPGALQELFRRATAEPDVFEAIPLADMQATQMYPLRAAAWVGALLAFVALALSGVGLYGVLSFTISQRTREIGIRMALGATAGAVVRLVIGQSARLAAVGALAGTAMAYAALKALSAVISLRMISFLDPGPFVAGVLAIAAAALAAAYAPARRTTRVDPAETLRAEA